jgi:hypothetical protein
MRRSKQESGKGKKLPSFMDEKNGSGHDKDKPAPRPKMGSTVIRG